MKNPSLLISAITLPFVANSATVTYQGTTTGTGTMAFAGSPSTVDGVTLSASASGFSSSSTGGFLLNNYYTDFAAAADTGASVSRPSSLGGFWIGNAANDASHDTTVTLNFSQPVTEVSLTFWAINNNIDGEEILTSFTIANSGSGVGIATSQFQDDSIDIIPGFADGFYEWDGSSISGINTFVDDNVWTNGDRYGPCCGETVTLTLNGSAAFDSVTFLHDVLVGAPLRQEPGSGPGLTNGVVLQAVTIETIPEPATALLTLLGMMAGALRRNRNH